MAAFGEIGVCPSLTSALEDQGWLIPTPVQQECVPLILGGGDVLAAAETGSGKTAAFALPVIQNVQETLVRRQRQKNSKPKASSDKQNSTNKNDTKAQGVVPCYLSEEDRDPMLAVSKDKRVCQSRGERNWSGCRATKGVFSGRHYYEIVVRDEGLCRVGWACTLGANLELGTCQLGFGYGGTAKKSNNKRYEDYGEKYGLNDVIGCGIDLGVAKKEGEKGGKDHRNGSGSIWFSKNGKQLGKAFDIPKKFIGSLFFPALCLKNAELECKFGGSSKQEGGKQIQFVKPLKHLPKEYTPIGDAGRDQSASADEQEPQNSSLNNNSNNSKTPLALILEPTRDLAEQTAKVVSELCESLSFPKLSCTACIGGLNPKEQIKRLQKGCDVVVGTPARVLDFVQSGKLNLSQIKFYVLDEADRLVAEKDTREIVLTLYKRLPKQGLAGEDRLQCLLFSATLHSEEIKKIAGTICQNPIWVDLKGRDTVPDTVHHVKYEVDPLEDRSWLQKHPEVNTDQVHACNKECLDLKPNSSGKECMSQAVKLLKPRVLQRIIDGFQMDQCLIFCRTNFDCDQLETFLNELGGGKKFRGKVEKGLENAYSCVVLAGARSMQERREALSAFKDGDVRFLICTDVAARGIDIKELPYVINMCLPDLPEAYIHRVGRVGRADTMGLAISIVSKVPERVWYCTKKGYKPWFEPNHKNTKLNTEGGHTRWYDEQLILKDIETKYLAKKKVKTLNLNDIQGSLGLGPKGLQYGEAAADGGASAEVVKRVAKLKPQVEALAELEVLAQQTFLRQTTF